MHTSSHTHTYMQTSRVISLPKCVARGASLVLALQMSVTLSSPFTDALVLSEDAPVWRGCLQPPQCNGSHLEMISLPRAHLTMSGDIFDCHYWALYWHPVGRGQGCCRASYNIQDRTPSSVIRPRTLVAPGLRNPPL